VGVPWLYQTDGTCRYCQRDSENLCLHGQFTGYDVNGGYAEYTIVSQDFAYAIPAAFGDAQAAPLLCAGVIGYRALRLSAVPAGGKLGMWGFGASAHITIQVAQQLGHEVYVATRSKIHQDLALQLGAKWAGPSLDKSNLSVPLDSAIIFAPAGGLVLDALKAVDKGGTVALAGIYMSAIPQMDYSLLYGERILRSVANSTRRDVEELLKIASEIPVRTQVQTFPLEQLNQALQLLKHSQIDGAGVIEVSQG
jgi:propanol-preferring alcohol dehydrogenase